MAFDKTAALGERELPRCEVETAHGTVTVRALTRAEVLNIQRLADRRGTLDARDAEARMLAAALVDPVLTLDEVKQWQKVAPVGELQPLQHAVSELSGLDIVDADEEAAEIRERMRGFRER